MNKKTKYENLKKEIESILTEFPEIKIAFLFGSAMRDCLKTDSDIDIAVSADKELDLNCKIKLVMRLSAVLPRNVDLVDLQQVTGMILQQVLCTGSIIKRTSSSLHAELLKKMWFNQADMMPLTKMVLKEHCNRFING